MSQLKPANATSKSRWRWLRWLLIAPVGGSVVGGIAIWIIVPNLNLYQVDGEIQLPGAVDEVVILRDGKGMPYIYGNSLRDLFFAQGFVTAQDRLFQIHLMRLKAEGRLTELAGDIALDLDVRSRTIGFARAAKRHAEILDEESRRMFQAYADGINAFIECCEDDIPLEFLLSGLPTEPWAVEDSLSLMYLMAWDMSANLRHEVIAQLLVDKLGIDQASLLFPLNVYVDTPEGEKPSAATAYGADAARTSQLLGLEHDIEIAGLMTGGELQIGSNNWVTNPAVSGGDYAMLAGDPHLDPRILPGIMYAVGYISPRNRAVGAGVPGIPGFIIGRNEHVATAVTNSYGDMQDLYVESIDPQQKNHYLQGGESLPFEFETETLRVRDASAADGFRTQEIKIRSTQRGPVVSGVFPGLTTDRVITLRWAALDSMQPRTGLVDLFNARSASDIDNALRSVTYIALNFVFADARGDIGWRASGSIPNRTDHSGALPFTIDPIKPWADNWNGWIPFNEMPHSRNPERGWLGTANHYTVAPDYPYYFSNFAAPSYRYRRLKQRIDASAGAMSVDEHWSIQRDTKNLMAEVLTGVFIEALAADEDTRILADVLRDWDFHDTLDQPGPTVFQSVYSELAKAIFRDELGEVLAGRMLENWYFWQERFQQIVLDDTQPWFDDQSTPDLKESREEMIRRAGKSVLARLKKQLGADPASWQWGRVHTMRFDNPIRRSGFGRAWLGSGPYPVNGSGETLYRGWYSFNDPSQVTYAAALRMVVDFGDSEKVRAVLAGGSTARTFHPHQKDQIEAYVSGAPMHWWFSDKAIEAHAVSRLRLLPD